MVAVTMTTPLPPAPQRGEGRDDFSDDADTFAEALTTYQIEQNQQASDLNDLAALIQALATSVVNSPNTLATSTSTVAIGLGARTFNIEPGKSIVEDMWVAAVDQADGTRWLAGSVDSYDTGTGQLILNSLRTSGTGNGSSWRVYAISPMLPDTSPRALAAGSTVKDSTGADRAIGYIGTPVIPVTTAHVLSLADVGCCLELKAGGSITVPLHSAVAFNPGDVILFREMAGATKSITPAAGVTLKQSGTGSNGARTVKAYGEGSIKFTGTNDLVFAGGDLS